MGETCKRKAGRVSVDGAQIIFKTTATIALDAPTLDMVEELGNGCISLAVRRMAAELIRLRAGIKPDHEDLPMASRKPEIIQRIRSQAEWTKK